MMRTRKVVNDMSKNINNLNFTRECAMNYAEEMHNNGSDTMTIPDCYSSIDGNVSFDSIEYFDECKTVIISPNVKTIPEYCFAGTDIRSVTMLGVELVSFSAFEGCRELVNLCAPNVKSIKENGFADCEKLSEVYMPNLSSISYLAFDNTNITTFDVSESMLFIGAGALRNPRSQITIELGKATPFIEGLSSDIFYTADVENNRYDTINGSLYSKDHTVLYSYCQPIDEHTDILPSTAVIERYAFCNAKADKIVIPESVLLIKDKAFVDANIETLEIRSRNVSIENNAGLSRADVSALSFPNDHSYLRTAENYIINGDTLIYLKIREADIEKDLFMFPDTTPIRHIAKESICYKLNKKISVFFPNDLVQLDHDPFSHGSSENISEVILHSNISEINDEAFEHFTGKVNLPIPADNYYSKEGFLYGAEDIIFPINLARYRLYKPEAFSDEEDY